MAVHQVARVRAAAHRAALDRVATAAVVAVQVAVAAVVLVGAARQVQAAAAVQRLRRTTTIDALSADQIAKTIERRLKVVRPLTRMFRVIVIEMAIGIEIVLAAVVRLP